MSERGPKSQSSITIVSGSASDLTPVSDDVDVEITCRQGLFLAESTAVIVSTFSRPVNDFQEDELQAKTFGPGGIELKQGRQNIAFLSHFNGGQGQRIFTAQLNIPDEAEGQVEIFINPNVATASTDASKMGPPERRSLTVAFNRNTEAIAPTVNITTPPTTKFIGKVYRVRFVFSEPINDFTASDISLDDAMASISEPVQYDLDGSQWTADLTLPSNTDGTIGITVLANAVQGAQRRGPVEDYTESFQYDSRTNTARTIAGGTLVSSDTKPLSEGTYNGVLEQIAGSTYIYKVVQVMHTLGSDPNNFPDTTRQAGAELQRIRRSDGSKVVIKAWDTVTTAARSLCFHKGVLHWFEGSAYAETYNDDVDTSVVEGEGNVANYRQKNYGWKADMGYIYKLNGTMPQKVGLVQRSAFVNPLESEAPRDTYYGIHIGTHSPMRSWTVDSDTLLNVIAGYGDLNHIIDIMNAVSEQDNWNWVAVQDRLQPRLPVVDTNSKTAWAVLEDIAKSLGSRIGFDGDRFVMQPAEPFQTSLAAAITDTDTTATFNEPNHIRAIDGLFLIDDEIVEVDENTLTRGQHNTTAAAHDADARMLHLDYYIALNDGKLQQSINTIVFQNAMERLKNVVKVKYGENVVSAKNDASIRRHGEHLLEVDTLLSQHQNALADWLAKQYVRRFGTLQKSAVIRLLFSPFLQVGQVIYIDIDDPRGFSDAVEVVEISHFITENETEINVVTV